MTAPKDFINDIERAIIDQLRAVFTDANIHVFGEYPQAADMQYPAIISEITSSGRFDKFMGESVSFGSEDKTGEIVGIMFTYHIIIDKDSTLTVTQDDLSTVVYKQRRLLNYLMLNVANILTDMGSLSGGSWAANTEVVQQDLNNWSDIGYDPLLEKYGASAIYMVAFKNYR